MYSQKVTDLLLDDFEGREGWRPVEHSIAEIEEFSEYANSIVNIESNQKNSYYNFTDIGKRITKHRQDQIKRFIINEQFMCFASCQYWKTHYAYICDEANEVFRYKPRKSQEVFHRILAPFDEQQLAIEIFLIKARQQGLSTEVVLDFMHRLQFVPYTQGVQASVNEDTTKLLSRIMNTCATKQPWWLVPSLASSKTTMPQWTNGSVMSIQSGNQKMGIAQGWTPSLVHVSEVADIPNPKKVLEEGLFRATHSTWKLFMVLEGTGADSTSWQAEKWKYYKANWGKGGRFLPVFIPWPCCPDLYPTKDWLRKNPIPELWAPMEETRRMTHKAQLFIRSTDYLAKIMGSRWEMTREQQWFWEANYREAAATHSHKVWLSQMPCTDLEALQSKHDKVFSDEVIEVVSEEKCAYEAFAITGNSVIIGNDDEPYFPAEDQIDRTKRRIEVSWKCRDGHTCNWELIPLKPFNHDDDEECFNKLLIFQHPKPNNNYCIGVDTADGLGNPNEDRTVGSVILNRDGNQRDDQVAEFVSNRVNPPQMASIAACVAAYYQQQSGDRVGTKDPRGVKFCIEQRMRAGDDCQFQLQLMGFRYHHIPERMDTKNTSPQGSNFRGFFSNATTVPILVNRFVDAVNNGWFRPNSPMLIRQMRDWVRKMAGGKSKLDHESGKHDDNIRAAAQGYFSYHPRDVLASRQQEKFAVKTDEQILTSDFIEAKLENSITI